MSETTLAPTVTVRVENGDAPAALRWESVLAVEGMRTGDSGLLPRILMPNSLAWRDLPLTLMAMIQTSAGAHEGAQVAGRIDEIWRVPRPDLGGNVHALMGRGVFDTAEYGQEIARLVGNRTLRGVSVDLAAAKWALADAETEELVEDDEIDFFTLLSGGYMLALTSADIGAATIASMQALEDATIALTASAEGGSAETALGIVLLEALTAAAPRVSPRSWFDMPEADQPTPLTITEDGHVFGHAFLWNTCHTGFEDRCVMAPRSPSNYAYFHLGAIDTQEGGELAVGQITLDTSHADLRAGRNATRRHYDDTGVAAADVRVSDGRFGAWFCGALREVSRDTVSKLKAAKLSGDWRQVNGALELIGLLAVNVPGFPIPRAEARMVASAAGEDVAALVAAGIFTDEDELAALIAEITGAPADELSSLAAAITAPATFKEYSAEQRKDMAKKGWAMPDGSFPIADCADAENAIKAQGRASEGKRPKVRAHIRKRVRALGCQGEIFDDYR